MTAALGFVAEHPVAILAGLLVWTAAAAVAAVAFGRMVEQAEDEERRHSQVVRS